MILRRESSRRKIGSMKPLNFNMTELLMKYVLADLE